MRLPAFAVLLWLTGCSLVAPKFIRPNVTVSGVQLQGGNLFRQTFLVDLHVQNPNDRVLPVNGVHAELRVDGDQLASGVTNRAFVVAAFGEADFAMTVTANGALALLKLANQGTQDRDSIDYELTGAVNVDLPFAHELPFRQGGSFSLKGQQ